MASSGIGDADDEGVGRMRLEAVADRLHHLEVDAEEVVAAHARLARDAGGDDADVGAGDLLVGVGALELGVELVDRARLGDVERLALGDALGDVEEHDVAELPERRQMGERPADLPGPDQCDLRPCHPRLSRSGVKTGFWLAPRPRRWQGPGCDRVRSGVAAGLLQRMHVLLPALAGGEEARHAVGAGHQDRPGAGLLGGVDLDHAVVAVQAEAPQGLAELLLRASAPRASARRRRGSPRRSRPGWRRGG